MNIKAVVFDVGNVLVRWEPRKVIQSLFPDRDPASVFQDMRAPWIDLNLGKITEEEAIVRLQKLLDVPQPLVDELIDCLKTSQTPIPGSIELLDSLYAAGIPLYCITDNIKEIIEYHRKHSKFLSYFKGVAVSATVGVLKPDARIYKYLLDTYKLNPAELVFFDDLQENVAGAIAVGMQSFQFTDAKACENKLMDLGLIF